MNAIGRCSQGLYVICDMLLGVLYGMGPQLAAARLGISVAAVNKITHSFFDRFQTVKKWMNDVKL